MPLPLSLLPRSLHPILPYTNTLLLSLSSCLFFACFSTTQSILTSLKDESGEPLFDPYSYYSLAVLYLVFSLGNFIAPLIENVLGAKWTLILGGLPYSLFVFSVGVPVLSVAKILLLVNGGILGMGAALFWVAHGDFIVRNAKFGTKDSRVGLFSGLFFSIFSLNGAIGNLLNGAMQYMGLDRWILFGVLGIVALIGVSSMVLLVPMPKVREEKEEENDDAAITRAEVASSQVGTGALPESSLAHNTSVDFISDALEEFPKPHESLTPQQSKYDSNLHQISTSTAPSEYNPLPSPASQNSIDENVMEDPVGLLSNDTKEASPITRKTKKNPILAAIINVFTSFKSLVRVFFDPKMLLFTPISFYSGASLGFFQGNIPPIFGANLVPWVMAVFSLCSGISAVLVGRLSDRLSKRIMMCVTFFIHISGLGLTFSLPYLQPYSFFWTMAVCGMSDAALNTMIYSYLGTYFEKVSAEGFAVFKFVQSLAAAVSFFFGSFLKERFSVAQYIVLGLWAASAGCFVVLEFFIAPVDKFASSDADERIRKRRMSGTESIQSEDDYGVRSSPPQKIQGSVHINSMDEGAPLQGCSVGGSAEHLQSYADYGSSSERGSHKESGGSIQQRKW